MLVRSALILRGFRTTTRSLAARAGDNGADRGVSSSLRRLSVPLPRTVDEYVALATTPPPHEGNFVKVAVVGDPNVGKSTLINKLICNDVCPVSKKPHTTRSSNNVAITNGQLQMVLVDTPGAVGSYHARRHNLPESMVVAPSKALERPVDVLAVVVDASDHWRREFLSSEVARLLERHRTECPDGCSILILNKIDRIRVKDELLAYIESLCGNMIEGQPVVLKKPVRTSPKRQDLKARIWQKEDEKENATEQKPSEMLLPPDPGTSKDKYAPRFASWPYFSRVFMVSATKEDGLREVRHFLEERARYKTWEYRPGFVYHQRPKELVQDITRERLLDNLRDEIPYELRPKVTYWEVDESGCTLHVHVSIDCKQERQVYAVLGPQGKTIQRITNQLRQRLCDIFHCEVALKVAVVNKNPKAKQDPSPKLQNEGNV